MSIIESYRVGDEVRQREMWDTHDIAEYCDISFDKADKLHQLANSAFGVKGYGDIKKEDFLEFIEMVEAEKQSRRLADEANAATILYTQKGFNFNRLSFWISQAISLLKNQ